MTVNAVAAIIGPNLGGFLEENLGRRYVFYINPQIGILAFLLALKFPETYGAEKQKIDIIGAILLTYLIIKGRRATSRNITGELMEN